jgi:hypothetical protein
VVEDMPPPCPIAATGGLFFSPPHHPTTSLPHDDLAL